ncbi:MAG: HesA/MoeB/ThiF family protein [Planctomycetes bacterium]|nr:HesA/MoeB/ThiF family protein [Planctomycetota bacterium]
MTQLTDEERATYEWQMWTPGFGEAGQEKLKASSALISRCGGLGSPVAYSLAAAGIGRLVIAHGGSVKHSDLNRQILMTYDWLGKPRAESAPRRLKELNPRLDVEGLPENVSDENVAELVSKVDIVFDCAPLFVERFAMNRECVRQGKPMIEAAMYGMEGQVTTILPGRTPCLACLYPEDPATWKREFPVFGAVSALAGAIAAAEGIKILAGFGETLAGTLLYYDTANMTFQRIPIARRPDCPVCGHL